MPMEMYKNIILALLQHSFAVTQCSFVLLFLLLEQLMQFGLADQLFLPNAFECIKSIWPFIKISGWPFWHNTVDMYKGCAKMINKKAGWMRNKTNRDKTNVTVQSNLLLIERVQNEVCSSYRSRDTAILVKSVCWYPTRNKIRRKRYVHLILPVPQPV